MKEPGDTPSIIILKRYPSLSPCPEICHGNKADGSRSHLCRTSVFKPAVKYSLILLCFCKASLSTITAIVRNVRNAPSSAQTTRVLLYVCGTYKRRFRTFIIHGNNAVHSLTTPFKIPYATHVLNQATDNIFSKVFDNSFIVI